MFPYQPITALDNTMGRVSNIRQPFQPNQPINVYEQQNILRQYQPQPQQQSNPYEDFKNVIGSCDENVKNGILSDPQYQEINNCCEMLIQNYMYNQIVPMVLQDTAGYDAFAKLANVTKQLKQNYESQAKNQLEELQKQLQLTQQQLIVNEQKLAKIEQEKGGVEIAQNDGKPRSLKKPNRAGNNNAVQNDTSKA